MTFIQIFGYIATVIIAVSLMMSSIIKLRIINLIGAAMFSTYGFIIGAYPVFVLNGFITLIDAYYLIQIFSAKEYFRVLEVKPDSEYLNYFLKFYESDIKKFMPAFSPEETSGSNHVMFVLRDTVPAGLVISEYLANDVIYMKLDYAVEGFRDFKIGKYVFAEIFKQKKVKKIYSNPGNERHQHYLKKMGFEKTTFDNQPAYCLNLY